MTGSGTRSPAAFTALLLAAAVAGCTPSGAAGPQTTAPDAPRPLPDDVRAAYDDFWATWIAANEDSDPRLPALTEHVADPLLSTLRANLELARAEDQVSRGTVGHRIEGMESDGADRRIVDCVAIGQWLLHSRSTGAPIPGQLAGDRAQLTEIVFRPYDGRWKATSMYILADEC
ncbi:hypothetical protein GCM10010112_61350 [Actinoplanes lobatus]|uniref:Nuclear transport factor 2 family protein n=1 Tax=Actinoplanes lobatus TaxID=113568 RepID=A0A7W7H8I3_9ACTN|nr:hypothetical protein [Actinoplanes lobatus]MBB4745990.1 hypothetical protein [Actinoplanes lobatus]GGN83229.1 hypothetical protein GCM10010112_61350 [Actinoplanes lobatus]GIE42325.1 hypothetical protein Alo02nite_52230 [Actinoplanes lobatus]